MINFSPLSCYFVPAIRAGVVHIYQSAAFELAGKLTAFGTAIIAIVMIVAVAPVRAGDPVDEERIDRCS